MMDFGFKDVEDVNEVMFVRLGQKTTFNSKSKPESVYFTKYSEIAQFSN